jgi:hypothetical protein
MIQLRWPCTTCHRPSRCSNTSVNITRVPVNSPVRGSRSVRYPDSTAISSSLPRRRTWRESIRKAACARGVLRWRAARKLAFVSVVGPPRPR